MTIRTSYYNVDFNNDIVLEKNSNEIENNIKETLNNLPALNILQNNNLLSATIEQTTLFAKNKNFFLVLGTGGSNLGARALINAFQGNKKK